MRTVTALSPYKVLLSLLVIPLFVLILSCIWVPDVFSETKQTAITASVPNLAPPTIPLLIAPNNSSFTTVSTPTFIWKAATSSATLSHYQLYLDDSIAFDLIPLTSTSNSQYTLTYNTTNDTYSLTPVLALVDGTHSWKIVVFDTNNNFASSAVWTFHLDSLAPLLRIEQVGSLSTSISSSNNQSIPTVPLELTDNEPELSGTGEPNAAVTITIFVEGETPYQDTFTIGPDGLWSYRLDTLPRDTLVHISFTTVDAAGNTSFIEKVPLIILSETILLIPKETETTPSPDVIPSSHPIPTPKTILTSLPLPKITIPVAYPLETARTVIKKTSTLIPQRLVTIGEAIVKIARKAIVTPLVFIAPGAALVATATVPTLTLLSLLLQLGPRLFYQALLRFLQTFGLLPLPDPQGLVFDAETHKPVAFARLDITQVQTKKKHTDIQETVITNTDGMYQGISLPDGYYVITVKHQDYQFPTRLTKPNYLPSADFYKGEQIYIDADHPPLFLIPVDFVGDTTPDKQASRQFWKLLVTRYSFAKLRVPLFLFSLLVTLFYPSFINILVVLAYIFIFAYDYLQQKKTPSLFGRITDEKRTPIKRATIRMYEKDTARLVALTQSDGDGYFSLSMQQGRYLINIMKNGYIWDEQAAQSYDEIVFKDQAIEKNIVLRKITELYQ